MSERDGFAAGVPCWIAGVHPEPRAAGADGSLLGEPLELGGAGRALPVADPAGAAFVLWEPAELRGAELVNEPGAWAMSILATTDTRAAERFYGEVFGWQTEEFGGAWMWRLPGFVGGEAMQPVPRDVIGVMVPTQDGRPPTWDVNLWVDDADETAARAEQLGGSVVVPPFDTEITRDAVLADPQGATFWVSTAPGP